MHARPTRSLPPVLILASMLLPGCESQPAEPLVGKLAIEAGDLQIGEAGSTLAIPLAVRLTNLRDEPLSGQRIRWQTEHNVVVRTVSTDETGTATFQPLLGPDAGEQRTIAVREGFPEEKVTFKSIVQVQGATQMEAGTGGHGSYVDTVLAVLPVPYEVRITDQDGAPVAGVGVAWTAKEGGAVSPPSSVTDANGVARATHVLGTRAGPQRVVASVEGLIGSPVDFQSTAIAGNYAAFVAGSPVARLGLVNRPLSRPYVVYPSDAHGNAIPEIVLSTEWVVTSGGGTIKVAPGGGIIHTLGPAEGVNSVSARAPSLPGTPVVSFQAWGVTALVYVAFDSSDYGCFWDGLCHGSFAPQNAVVPVGKSVGWGWYFCSGCTAAHEIVFENAAMPVRAGPDYTVFRFDTSGTYRYRCTVHSTSYAEGETGMITVR